MALIVVRNDEAAAKRAERAQVAGKLKRIYAGIYTDQVNEPLPVVVRRELYTLCAILAPGATISHRSALENGPGPHGDYFLTGDYRRTLKLPGVQIKISEGPRPLDSDLSVPTFFGPVFRASEARAFLENLQRTRTPAVGDSRVLPADQLDDLLEKRLSLIGEDGLNGLRDIARAISPLLNLKAEWEKFDRMVGGLLGTRQHKFSSPAVTARVAGTPYDGPRVDLFDKLLSDCSRGSFKPFSSEAQKPLSDPRLGAFVESYFSNYIEGTEFELEEAREIVLEGKPMVYREDDSHDILGTYNAILQSIGNPKFPETLDGFVTQLCDWNRMVIQTRTAKRPGEFKTSKNQAGNTIFVIPEYVRGTLEKGFERIMAASPGSARAAIAMFVITEVHPFADGNGRTARLAMNLALSEQNLGRVIIPTAFRDDYILALKALTNNADTIPYLRMLTRASAFSQWLDLNNEARCFQQLHESNALKKPNEGKLTFPVNGSGSGSTLKSPG